MDDPSLKEEGKKWVRFYGCGGCHEISGMEDEGRIGTELIDHMPARRIPQYHRIRLQVHGDVIYIDLIYARFQIHRHILPDHCEILVIDGE